MALDIVSGAGVRVGDLFGIIGGVALIVLKCADYVARTNPTDKGDKERPVERVQRRAESVPMGV